MHSSLFFKKKYIFGNRNKGSALHFMLCSQLFSFFIDVRYSSLLFVTVRYCSEQFRTVFFSKFQCNFTFVEKIIKFYNFVYCRVRHRLFLFRTSCDRYDENLPLKYIVERTQFYVSLKLEKTVTNCSVEKIIPLKYIVERTSCDRAIGLRSSIFYYYFFYVFTPVCASESPPTLKSV